MIVNFTYASNVSNAPAGFTATLNAVANFFQSTFSDPVTVNINVGFGTVNGQALGGGALGESLTYLSSYTYSQLKTALAADAKTADDTSSVSSLPGNDPTGGHYWVSTAEAKALGLAGASSSLDGYIGFTNAAGIFDYDNSNGVSPGTYDFFAVVAHEVSEVMGRQLLVGASIGGTPNGYEPMDLFHFSAPGVRTFTGTQPGYFSVNNGTTNLDNWNTNPNGDFGDWAASAGNDAALAFSNSGVVNAFSPTDIKLMDVLGWDSTAAGPDTTPPTLSTTSPADNSANVAVGANLVLTFSENVKAGSGNLVIHNALDGSVVATIAIIDASQVSFAGAVLTINPTSDLAAGTHYYVTMASGVVQDLAGNAYAGLSAATDFDFTTAPPDTTPPTLSTTTPADNSTNVAVGANLVLTFSESVKAGSGNLVIHNALDGSVVATIAITDASQVTFAGSTLTVNPTSDLAAGTHYYVTMASGVVQDLAGNAYAGLLAATDLDFTTAQTPVLKVRYDIDGDGHSDILWQNDSGQAAVWLMNGTNLVTSGNVGTADPAWHAKSAGDFDGDGKADILVQNNSGQAAVWLMNGTTVLSTTNVGSNLGTTWHVKSTGDFNGDGKADILWQNDSGQAAVWLMNGTSVLSSANVGANLGTSWHVKGTGDFNGDGKADILWQNDNGQAAVWLMNGTSVLSTSNVGGNSGTSWHVKGTGDFNGDGKSDILWQNDNGQVATWLMNGTTFVSGVYLGSNPGSSWHAKGAEDFNGDGKSDIVWQNNSGQAMVWLMNGTTVLTTINVGPNLGSSWHVISNDDVIVAGPDTTPPTLSTTTPADNSTNVAVGANLVLTFSESVKAGSGNVVIHNALDGSAVATIAISDASQVSFAGSVLTINPTSDLAAGTHYYVTMASGVVQDLAGNAYAGLSAATDFDFTTTTAADTTPPTLSTTTPADNSTNVAVGANLFLTFSENVAAGSGNVVIHNALDGSAVATIAITDASQVSFAGSTLTINPTSDLAAGTHYYVTMASGVVQDLAGNAYAGLSAATDFDFTTAPPADTTPPTLSTTTPADNSTNVAVGANLVLTFSENVAAGSGNVVIHNALDGSAVATIAITDASQVSFAASTLTINPTSDLAAGTHYYVTMASGVVQDLAGNAYAGLSAATDFDFTTAPPADTTPPTLSTTTPADNSTNVAVGANLVLTFSENVAAGSGNVVIHNALDGSAVATIAITDASQVSFAGAVLTINPTSDLALGTHYYVTMASGVVQDLAGNAYAGLSAATDFDFTTAPPADTTPPTLSTTTPADNSTNVAVGANLVLTFSESVKAGSGNVVIHNALDGSAVATIAISDASQVSFLGSTLTINPTSDLAAGTHYYVTMASGVVQDLAGNAYAGLSAATDFDFTTAPPADTTPPTLSTTTPADNSTNVAVGANLVLTFSESVKAGSGNVVIHNALDGSVVVTIAISDASQVSFAGSTLTINPTSDLALGTHYYVTMASGVVQDLAGNAYAGLSAATDFDFTTTTTAPLKVRYDFDGDGHSDILLQSDSGQAAVWLMNGTNVLANGNVGAADPTWHVKSAGDFDGDGKADILLQNDSGQAAVWLMNGTTLLSNTNVGANLGTSWHAISAGDFNGDGKADILWQNDSGQAAVWLMNGTSVLSTSNVGANLGTSWHVKGTGDFNGDGKADILWQNDNGQGAIWLMNGTSVLSASNLSMNSGVSWHIKGAGDFNGDGKSDILWQNDNGQVATWLMNGTSFLSGVYLGTNPGSSWHVKGAEDFNGDGKADILWQNDSGQAMVWLMNGTTVLTSSNVGANPGSPWHVTSNDHAAATTMSSGVTDTSIDPSSGAHASPIDQPFLFDGHLIF